MRYRVLTVLAVLLLVTGALAQTENILVNFSSSGGYEPMSPVMVDSSGNLWGATAYGGTDYSGTVYQVLNSSGTWVYNTIWNFQNGTSDLCYPYYNGVVLDSSGNVYVAAPNCGAYEKGGVAELSYSGGVWSEKLIYSFTGAADGAYPYAGLAIDSKGVLYGTAYEGGGGGCYGGCGVVYTLTNTNGTWKQKVIHMFKDNGTDGWYPYSPVTLDSQGNVYGTTYEGAGFAYGGVYELTKAKKGAWKEKILHYFYGYPTDGCNPYSGVAIDKSGNLYGTTSSCGQYYDGMVYQVKKSGKKYTESQIFSFDYSDGYYPFDYGTVAVDSSGNVYGTAYYGGAYYYGTVFELAAGTWSYTDLHDFDYNGIDGAYAYSGLAIDSNGYLYGTTEIGGSNYDGTVYQIIP